MLRQLAARNAPHVDRAKFEGLAHGGDSTEKGYGVGAAVGHAGDDFVAFNHGVFQRHLEVWDGLKLCLPILR